MQSYRPVSVVVTHGDVAGRCLNHQHDGRKFRRTPHRFAVDRSVAPCGEDIVDDWNGDDTNEHSVEPLHEDLEGGVTMVFSTRIDLLGMFGPIRRLFLLRDIKVPCSKACWPFRARLACIVDANGTTNYHNGQRHHDEEQRQGGRASPPGGLHEAW